MLRSLRKLPQLRQIQSTASCATQTFNGVIPTERIAKRFSLSSGPGGQNVQKNATKAEIRFNVDEAEWLSDELRRAIAEKFAHRINSRGELIIDSDRTRERHLNLADCFDKLRSEIYAIQENLAKRQTTEDDTRILRQRAAISAQRRLAEKRKLSEKKVSRRSAAVEL
ncbi:unnamed protein product [Caenorhabditis bovis]|uniref:Large ribosomal subunit protein mL62 n=1 Tax=Caenorhabditis bovis TaxID=2654633 RepID=A0A8S1ECX5_9PELO|nr:unnamed protein product [Caenorhabditis bovis]